MKCPVIEVCKARVTYEYFLNVCKKGKYLDCENYIQHYLVKIPCEWLKLKPLKQHRPRKAKIDLSKANILYEFRGRYGGLHRLLCKDSKLLLHSQLKGGRLSVVRSVEKMWKRLANHFKGNNNVLRPAEVGKLRNSFYYALLNYLKSKGKVVKEKEGKNVYWKWIGGKNYEFPLA